MDLCKFRQFQEPVFNGENLPEDENHLTLSSVIHLGKVFCVWAAQSPSETTLAVKCGNGELNSIRVFYFPTNLKYVYHHI